MLNCACKKKKTIPSAQLKIKQLMFMVVHKTLSNTNSTATATILQERQDPELKVPQAPRKVTHSKHETFLPNEHGDWGIPQNFGKQTGVSSPPRSAAHENSQATRWTERILQDKASEQPIQASKSFSYQQTRKPTSPDRPGRISTRRRRAEEKAELRRGLIWMQAVAAESVAPSSSPTHDSPFPLPPLLLLLSCSCPGDLASA
jgi:hypothetical protein